MTVSNRVHATYRASLPPDGTAFAHLVDDGGYPRAVSGSCAAGGPVPPVMSTCPGRER